MSREHLETFRRGIEAFHRGDIEAVVEIHDPEVEWHPMIQVLLGGEQAVYRGHEGVREQLRDLDEAFSEVHIEISDVRDLGDRLLANGRLRVRGRESGAETESPISFLTRFTGGRVSWVRTYVDPEEASRAAELSSALGEIPEMRQEAIDQSRGQQALDLGGGLASDPEYRYEPPWEPPDTNADS